jgi:uncharacterized protein (DUF1501 family)
VTYTRRELLSTVFPRWMPRLAFRQQDTPGDVLVCIFLRGGADGLNLIVPYAEDAYYAARTRVAIPRPDDNRIRQRDRVLDLDGFFGLNPAAGRLLPVFQQQHMIAVHAVGSPDVSRSHFDAMNLMERGVLNDIASGTGWLGRHLNTHNTNSISPLRAVTWGPSLPVSLLGSMNATALKSILDYHLPGDAAAAGEMLAALNNLYRTAPESLRLAAEQTSAVLGLNVAAYQPSPDAVYGDGYGNYTEFDMALMQTAALIKADIGLEVAAVDLGGWDTHQDQAPDFNYQLSVLANSLAGFHADLGERIDRVTVVVMSEFGRRLQENASAGTDHGHGGVMLVMNGEVAPQPVVANWLGLDEEHLDDGDLAVTIDYRDVLADILNSRIGNTQLDAVFPGYSPTFPNLFRKSE